MLDKALRIEFSMLMRVFLSWLFLSTMSSFFCSSWGFYRATIWASICYSRPEGVMAKLMMATLTKVSGG